MQRKPFPSEAKDFYTYTNSHKGIFFGICNKDKSGCIDHNLSFKNVVPNALYLPILAVFDIKGYDVERFQRAIKSESSPEGYQFLTFNGCSKNIMGVFICDFLANFPPTKLERIFIIIPPFQSLAGADYYQRLNNYRTSLASLPYRVDVLVSDAETDLPYSLGIPRPCMFSTEVKPDIPRECYGLMYIGYLQSTKDIKPSYLTAYFNKVKLDAMAKGATNISVQAIHFPAEVRKPLEAIAASCGIRLNHRGTLPQKDFIEYMREIKNKNGTLFFDGVQSLIQALSLGANSMIYPSDTFETNKKFYLQLTNKVSPALKPYAEVMLGFSSNHVLLNDSTLCAAATNDLARLINSSISHADLHRSTGESKMEVKGVDTVESLATKYTEFSYSDVDPNDPADDYLQRLQDILSDDIVVKHPLRKHSIFFLSHWLRQLGTDAKTELSTKLGGDASRFKL